MLKKKSQKGFSLVELMVVVAIIGILAALAVPKFQVFQAKAKASEAATALASAYTLQVAYHSDNDTYGTLSAIGFSLNGVNAAADALAASTAAKVRYSYAGTGASTTTFLITATVATGILGSCQSATHTRTVDQNKTFNAPGIAGC